MSLRRCEQEDLGSIVYASEVLGWAADELPALYESCYPPVVGCHALRIRLG